MGSARIDPAGTERHDLYAGPVKRSVTIAGHMTSVSLEPPFWRMLEAAAHDSGVPLNALIARIDADRAEAGGVANLASVLRCWVLRELRPGDRTLHNATKSQ